MSIPMLTASPAGGHGIRRPRGGSPGEATTATVTGNDARRSIVETQFLNPPGLCPTFGWTHVVTAAGGKTVHVSGQVSVNERGEVVGKGDLKAQTQQAFENLKTALAAAGATFRDVVKMN